MNIFGYVYLGLTIIGMVLKIMEIDRPRKPVTHVDAVISIAVTTLLFFGLYIWGIR